LNKVDLNSHEFERNYQLLKNRFSEDIIKISSKENINLHELADKCRSIAERYGINKL